MKNYISVYITVSSLKEADDIARALVEAELAACVNILPGVRSVYRWQGEIEEAKEIVLIAKSRGDLFAQIEQKVTSLSSSSCPCIVAWPILAGHQPYLDWISANID